MVRFMRKATRFSGFHSSRVFLSLRIMGFAKPRKNAKPCIAYDLMHKRLVKRSLFLMCALTCLYAIEPCEVPADSIEPARAPKSMDFFIGDQRIIETVTRHDYNGIAKGVMSKEFVILSPGVRYWAFLPPSTGYRGKDIENITNENPVNSDGLNNR